MAENNRSKAFPGTAPVAKNVDKTVVKAINLSGGIFGACPAHVDVKDGKVVRIRPLHYDSKYDYESFNAWEMERNGVKWRPLSKSVPPPWGLAYKKRAYSPNRVPYPMKRVDWDPNGERNTQNRGSSKFERISWDEATDLIAAEIKRLHKDYGPLSILLQCDGHSESKLIHAPHGCSTLLLDKMGGFTQQVRNPDSWEGWYWGAKHVWGKGFIGNMAPAENLVVDITENTELLIVQGGDLETTPWGFRGQMASRLMFFWNQCGIEQVYICPDLNYSAAIHGDKWIPVLPNTDAALQLAIIYTWVTEGTYDKEYVKTHVVGMEEIENYVLGKVDGVPKTPKWAEGKCAIPSYTIKALAREWSKKVTTVGHYFGGGYIRGPYSTEPARLEVVLLGMQGLGKPGRHHAQIAYMGMPKNITWDQLNYDIANSDTSKGFQEYSGTFETIRAKDPELHERIFNPHRGTPQAWGKQLIPKVLIEEAIKAGTDKYIEFWGTGGHEEEPIDQCIRYTYPCKKGDLRFRGSETLKDEKIALTHVDTDIEKTYYKIDYDGVPIRMVWTDTPCRQTCWGDGFDIGMTIRDPQVEFVLAQHPWLENDCIYADIVLPTNTYLEVDDVMPCVRDGEHFQSMLNMKKAIEPVGESKSDFEAVVEIAKKLGMEKEVTIGRTVDQYIEGVYKGMNFDKIVPYEEWCEKDYMVIPVSDNWRQLPAGLYEFAMDPVKNPLPTPTGKLEFCSTNLSKYFPNDQERPPYPQWIEKGITHDERLSSSRARTYPLLIITNHPRWRVHAQADDIPWTKEADTGKIRGFDGYLYEPCWIHPSDAEARGIKQGDIVRVFNERGSVLCGALVFERMMPGALSVDHGARTDIIIPGKLDRGGAINLITPKGITSKHAGGQATTSFLVEVERVSMAQYDEWKTNYPEAWNREYDRASGLKAAAWVERGSK